MVPGVTLGGVKLSCLPGQQHSWAITSDVNPYVGEFLLTRARAEAILSRGGAQLASERADRLRTRRRGRPSPIGPLEFRIDAPGAKPLVVRGLYVTSLKAGTDHNTWTVQVSDRRWLWSRIFIERSYNLRKGSGTKRWNGEALVPLQAAETVADVTHRRASLRNGISKWAALEILEDVLTELCGVGGFVIEASAKRAAQTSIQDLDLHDQGPQALARVLAHIPGVTVCPGLDGKIRVFSTLDGSENRAAFDASERIIAGSGFWRAVDRSLVRPEKVRVFFTREHEVRFDTYVGGSYSKGRQPPILENVIQVPDARFKLADGREVAGGSWITFDEFYAGLASGVNVSATGAGATPAGVEPVTDAWVRKYALAGLAYGARLYVSGTGFFDAVWASRFAAIGRCWRRFYRIGPQWADRMRAFRARRAVITDAENGLRAPSPVYANHVLKPHLRSLSPKGTDVRAFQVSDSWAANLADGKPAPVNVQIVDEGAGIIQLAPRSDLFGVYEDIQLGEMDLSTIPAPVGDAASLAALWLGSKKGAPVSLKEDFRVATILSMVPASPNNEGRLHEEEVSATDAAGLLGVPAPAESKGPVYETFSGLEAARYAWADDRKAAIHRAVFSGGDLPRDLLVNPGTVRDVARAQAARILSHLLDRAEGAFSVMLNPTVRPTGNLRTVTHTFALDGENKALYTTRLDMPPAAADIRVDALLPESTRRVLLRLVQE